jgi:hypothetical protein
MFILLHVLDGYASTFNHDPNLFLSILLLYINLLFILILLCIMYVGTPVKYMVFDSPFLSMEQILEDAVDKIHNDGYTYIPRKVFDLLTTFFRSGIRDRVQGMVSQGT